MSWSRATKRKAGLTALAAATALTVGVGVSVVAVNAEHNREQSEPHYVGYLEKAGGEAAEEAEREREAGGTPRVSSAAPTSESGEIATALDSVANARLAPYGSVGRRASTAPRSAASTACASSGTAWTEVTNTPYDADDPAYRDPNYSNSSGGAGYVAGRITGLAAGNGCVFAGGANGGVFRKSLGDDKKPGGGDDGRVAADLRRHPVAVDRRPALRRRPRHPLVRHRRGEHRRHLLHRCRRLPSRAREHRIRSPRPTGSAAPSSRAAASTSSSSAAATSTPPAPAGSGAPAEAGTLQAVAWQNVLMPNPAADSDITTPYKNIVNDVAIDPKPGAVLANAAWRSGDASYNGFYLSPTGEDGTFTRINPSGAINPKDIGNTEFAYAADGSKVSTP